MYYSARTAREGGREGGRGDGCHREDPASVSVRPLWWEGTFAPILCATSTARERARDVEGVSRDGRGVSSAKDFD